MGSSAGSLAIEPELLARFKAALDRLNPEGRRIGLAVSGGPDSMAMLLLAHEAIPGQFEVATVDHGLRPEAREECALVAAACVQRGVPCAVLTVQVGEGNVQARGRFARYSALGKWAQGKGLAAVATAHHADDQAETVLMRLNRASGLEGLTGIRAKLEVPYGGFGPGTVFSVMRPLLEFRRAELALVVAAAAIDTAQDPSNEDDAYDRVRMRKALANADWLDPAAIAASARHLAEAQTALSGCFLDFYDKAIVSRIQRDGEVDLRLKIPAGAARYFVLKAVDWSLRGVGGDPRGGDVARLVARLEAGEGGNVAGALATVEGDEWYFRREPPRRSG